MHFPTKLDGSSIFFLGGGGKSNPDRIPAIFFNSFLFEPLTFEICFNINMFGFSMTQGEMEIGTNFQSKACLLLWRKTKSVIRKMLIFFFILTQAGY